ncbi:MAG: glycosyltransferase [Sarcina sp.]
MKKIGIIIPSLSDGGAEKVAANLSIIYKELGYDVYIILYENRVSFEYEGTILSMDIKPRSGAGKIFKDYEIYSKLKSLKKQYNFDAVISHLPKTDLINCLTKKNEKVITTIHSNIKKDYPTYMQKMLPTVIKKSDLIAAVSRVGEEYLKDTYSATNVKTIYNPQMLDKIAELSKEEITEFPKELFDSEVIINIGRLSEEKGHWHLIRAFSEVVKNRPNAKLVLVGRGYLEERLRNLASGLGIKDNVIFTGFNKNPYKFLNVADLYVSTSVYEGLPMTYLEAMSRNIPIISTDCISGPREIIAPSLFGKDIDYKDIYEYGILVPNFASVEEIDTLEISDQEKNLAQKIEMLLNDKQLYNDLAIKAKERSKDFDYKNIKKIWKKELDDLLGENNG